MVTGDVEDWLKNSKASTYADDTETGVSGDNLDEIKRKMEEDGEQVLRYMASNGLVANPKKIALIFLNVKNPTDPIKLTIGGETIKQEKNAKLLGMTVDDNQKWQSQINGTGGMLSSLNQRLFLIKRLRNSLNYSGLRKVAESLYISKVRYGLQLMGEVRWTNADSESVSLGRGTIKLSKFPFS